MSTISNDKIKTYKEFWPFYLKEHSHPLTRVLHFIGTSLAFVCAVMFLETSWYVYLVAGLISGYGFAWVSHFTIEKNRPATFKYPFWSFISDWRLWFLMLIGKNPKT